jgi:tetraacyldisaccharide 4'-kinase
MEMTRLDIFFWLGRPFGPIYGWLMQLRAFLYRKGFFSRHTLNVPVISVGNLVLGGSGKTPIVKHLAIHLQQQGWRPAIISRGYKGQAKAPVNLVADGQAVLMDAKQAGDEPFMLASQLPGIPVLTGKKRIDPARMAVAELGVDIIILDDGFQHLSLYRDLDIVLFDATALAGNSRIFPGGELREPVSALRRGDIFLLTGQSPLNKQRSLKFKELLEYRWPHAPVFVANHNCWQLKDLQGKTILLDANDRYYGFSGIANPNRFLDSLTTLHLHLTGFYTYPDHASYSQSGIEKLQKKARGTGATKLVTTPKDSVKLQDLHWTMPVGVLHIEQYVPEAFTRSVTDAISM